MALRVNTSEVEAACQGLAMVAGKYRARGRSCAVIAGDGALLLVFRSIFAPVPRHAPLADDLEQALIQAGVVNAVVKTTSARDRFTGDDGYRGAGLVLRAFPDVLDAPVPARWADAAAAWLDEVAGDERPVVLGANNLPVAANGRARCLRSAAATRGSVALLQRPAFGEAIASVAHLEAFGYLTAATAGFGREELGTYASSLEELARDLAPDAAYIAISVEPGLIGAMFGGPFPSSGPFDVTGVLDRVPEPCPYQVLTGRHAARARSTWAWGALPENRYEVKVGEWHDWWDAVKEPPHEGEAAVQHRARGELADLLA